MLKNAIVGQSGGPTAVINSSLAGVFKTATELGIPKVYGMVNGIQGLLQNKYIDLSKCIAEEMDIELLKRTPSAFLGSCRYKLPEVWGNEELYRQLFDILAELNIGYFFYIGGNDSMDTIMKLSEYAADKSSPIRFVGIPKTIDNDLNVTDHTPGYGSAAKFIAAVTKEIVRDSIVYDSKSITLVEVMGRNAGWLAGAAKLSAASDCPGPDLIYLPEITFNIDNFLETISGIITKKPMVVVVSEGIKTEDGRYVSELGSTFTATDVFGHRYLTGTARFLADTIAQKLGYKTRGIELSTMQRCASHMVSRVDITEAFQVGGAAVKAAIDNQTGCMVVLRRLTTDPYICVTDLCDLKKIANIEKKVPTNWICESGTDVSERFVHYAMPLIQGELSPYMVAGLPQHMKVVQDYM